MKKTPLSRAARMALPLTLAALGSAVLAQDQPPAPPELPPLLAQAGFEREFVIENMFDFAGSEMGSERVIKGAPYCADAVHESVQWLPDGNGGTASRITRQTGTRLCRDGEGRTRQEMDRGNGRKLVFLRDPVARESWVLDPERKSARRLGDGRGGFDAAAWRDYSERMREFARATAERARAHIGTGGVPPVAAVAPVAPVAPVPPMPVLINTPEAGASGAGREVRVLRLRNSGDEAGEWTNMMPPVPPAVQWRAQSLAPRGGGTVSPLPGKDIEGLRANGERTTWVIEAGMIGNDKPLQITREVWTSPELMVTVSSRDFDPRSGETNYRLKNLKRGEPDAALMRVPADYAKPASKPRPGASGPTG